MDDDGLLLRLVSPYGGDAAVYQWPLPTDKNVKHDGCIEIIETIRCVFEDLPELRDALTPELKNIGDMKNYHSMRKLCEKYNTALEDILSRKPLTKYPLKWASADLLKHIMQKSYNHAVTDPEKLNEYKSWTPEVYGETSFEFVAQMLDNLTDSISQDEYFIDLGSGVGQVVLQVAATLPLKRCIGIEKAEVPDAYSKELDRQFKFWMKWFGRTYSDYELIHGDFFEPRFHNLITSSSFIFVNNYAFGPKVDHMLKKLFEELPDGSRIFSSRAFSPVNFRITDRNLNDIGTMMHVRELQPTVKGSVSWTDNSVSYYCHTIDRRILENYFANMKQPKKDGDKRGRGRPRHSDSSNTPSSSGNESSNDAESPDPNHSTNHNNNHGSKGGKGKHASAVKDSNNHFGDDENIVYGPTTRKAWAEFCNSLCKQDVKKPEKEKSQTSSSSSKSDSDSQAKPQPKAVKKQPSTDSSSSNSDKESNNENAKELAAKKSRGRPRKYPPGVSAVVNRAKKSYGGIVSSPKSKGHKVSVPEANRKPGRGRPPKSQKSPSENSLDMLHQQTLLSIQNRSGKRLSPAPGCVDQKLKDEDKASKVDMSDEEELSDMEEGQPTKDKRNDLLSTSPPPFPSSLASLAAATNPGSLMPSVIIKDSSLLSVDDQLDRLMDKWKCQIMSFLTHMQMPEFKSSLVKSIESEKNRRHSLTAQIDSMEKAIKGLQERGVLALKAKLTELGINATTSEDVIEQARLIIAQNKHLIERENQLVSQVAKEELTNSEIRKIIEKNVRENKMDKRFLQDLTPRLEDMANMECFPKSTPSSANSSPARSQSSATTRSSVGVAETPAATTAKGRKAAAKPKKEVKKRASKGKGKGSAVDKSLSLLEEPPTVEQPLKKPFDLSDAKISIKGSPLRDGSVATTGSPDKGHDSPEDAPRLTLTFVINRENNSASVKSPSKTPPHHPKSPADGGTTAGKRKKRSPSRDSKGIATAKKTRTSKSSGPDTSSESETRIKIKLASKNPSATKNGSVEAVVASPATEKLAAPTVITKTTEQPEQPPRIAATKTSKFGKLLAVASAELEASNSGSTSSVLSEVNRTLVPSPTISASSRPSSSASSSSFNATTTPSSTTTFAHTMADPLTIFGKRAPGVNTPPLTPSPSLSSSDRPTTPGGNSTASSISPLLHQQQQQQQQNQYHQQPSAQPQGQGNYQDGTHQQSVNQPSDPPLPTHQQYFNSLSQSISMKNLASLNPAPSSSIFGPTSVDVSQVRRKGRPPKKSINEMWASQSQEMMAQAHQQQQQQQSQIPPQTSSSSFSSSHPHLSSSLSQCQYSSNSATTTNSNHLPSGGHNDNNVATDYSLMRNKNTIYGQQPSTQAQPPNRPSGSTGRPPSTHDTMTNYFNHYSAAGTSGPQSVPHSVIQRHETGRPGSSSHPTPPQSSPYSFPPGFPLPYALSANMNPYNYMQSLNGINKLAEVAFAQSALFQQQPSRSGPTRGLMGEVAGRK